MERSSSKLAGGLFIGTGQCAVREELATGNAAVKPLRKLARENSFFIAQLTLPLSRLSNRAATATEPKNPVALRSPVSYCVPRDALPSRFVVRTRNLPVGVGQP